MGISGRTEIKTYEQTWRSRRDTPNKKRHASFCSCVLQPRKAIAAQRGVMCGEFSNLLSSCNVFRAFGWAPRHSYKENFPVSETGGCPICPFLFPELERASRGRWRECEEMCWLLGAASLNSFMSAGKRAALDSRSLHGRNGATHCPTLLMQPVDFSLAPLLLAPLFF